MSSASCPVLSSTAPLGGGDSAARLNQPPAPRWDPVPGFVPRAQFPGSFPSQFGPRFPIRFAPGSLPGRLRFRTFHPTLSSPGSAPCTCLAGVRHWQGEGETPDGSRGDPLQHPGESKWGAPLGGGACMGWGETDPALIRGYLEGLGAVSGEEFGLGNGGGVCAVVVGFSWTLLGCPGGRGKLA